MPQLMLGAKPTLSTVAPKLCALVTIAFTRTTASSPVRTLTSAVRRPKLPEP